ncbi:MAG: hypothetical protein KGL38_01945 [Gemmatimonadota bacterium]|nr:hypothetical protein [Gemmatimonadota bacterium]
MMRRNLQFTIVLGAVLVAGVAACHDSQPVGLVSVPASTHRMPLRDDGTDGSPQLLACPAHRSATGSATVGVHGGVLRVGGDKLIIPGGALDTATLITATIPADTLADIQFGPEGLHFAKPVTLVMSTSGCSTGGRTPHHVVYLDGDGQVLETLTAMPAAGGNGVVTWIGHFSSYAVAF